MGALMALIVLALAFRAGKGRRNHASVIAHA